MEWQDILDDARDELRSKPHEQIQVETAYKWAARACAAQELRRTEAACDYGHEAIEHAALSGDDAVLQDVRALLDAHGVYI